MNKERLRMEFLIIKMYAQIKIIRLMRRYIHFKTWLIEVLPVRVARIVLWSDFERVRREMEKAKGAK